MNWPARWLVQFGLATLLFTLSYGKQLSGECSQFRTLSTEPKDAKHKILAVFPLYESNCQMVRAQSVQALFAVQWALATWNKNSQNFNNKIGLTVVGLCYDEEEFIAETFQLLQSSGYFEEKNCRRPGNGTVHYLLLPEISPHYEHYAHLLKMLNMPMVTFSTSTTQLKSQRELKKMFSVDASLEIYSQVLVSLLKKLSSNWVQIVSDRKTIDRSSLENFEKSLVQSKIVLEKTVEGNFNQSLPIGRSQIVILLSSRSELVNFFHYNGPTLQGSLVISVPTTDKPFDNDQRDQLLSANRSFSLLLLEQHWHRVDDFEQYFVELLKRNARTYALLASYTHSQYNCSLVGAPNMVDCNTLGEDFLHKRMAAGKMAHRATFATYAIAAMVRSLSKSEALTQCAMQRVESNCTGEVDKLLSEVRYTFGPDDPQSLRGASITFDRDRTLSSVRIDGRLLSVDSTRRTMDKKILEYSKADRYLNLYSAPQTSNGQPMRSYCPGTSQHCRACSNVEKATTSTAHLLRPGHIYLAGLFDLRQWDDEQQACKASTVNNNAALAATLVYTLETFKQKYAKLNLLPNVEVGALLTDTCGSATNAVDSILQLRRRCLRFDSDNVTISYDNVLAYVSGQQEEGYNAIKAFFNPNSGIYQPLISAGCSSERCSSREISLVPEDHLLAKALQSLFVNFKWNLASALVSEDCNSCLEAFEQFHSVANAMDICITEILFPSDAEVPQNRVVVVFTTQEDFANYVDNTLNVSGPSPVNTVFLLTGNSYGAKIAARPSGPRSFRLLSIQPSVPPNAGLEVFLNRATPKHLPQSWLSSLWQELLGCSFENRTVEQNQCATDDSQMQLPISGQMVRERYLMAAVESWIILTDEIYKKLCPKLTGLCDDFYQRYPATMAAWIRLIKSMDRFSIFSIQPQMGDDEKIGRWSVEGGLQLSDGKETIDSIKMIESRCQLPTCHCKELQKYVRFYKGSGRQMDSDIQMPSGNLETAPSTPSTNEQWRAFHLNYVFLALSSALSTLTLIIMVFIIVKMLRHVVKGNQSLGICLLFGVLLLYATSYFFIFDPTDPICRLRHFCHSFSYSLCFAVLIAKAVQLRNSETIGINGYISLWNYWLLLFFIVSVQIALNLQWTLFRTPMVLHFVTNAQDESATATCGWTNNEFLSSHSYVFLLLVIAFFISFVNRNVKRNYKETRWLLYTCSILLPLWVSWTVGYVITPHPYKDALVVVELLCCATVILTLMFAPKLYLLIFYEPVLIEYPNSIVQESVKELYDLEIYADGANQAFAGQLQKAGSASSASGCQPLSSSSGSSPSITSTKYQAVIWKKSKSKRLLANSVEANASVMTGFGAIDEGKAE